MIWVLEMFGRCTPLHIFCDQKWNPQKTKCTKIHDLGLLQIALYKQCMVALFILFIMTTPPWGLSVVMGRAGESSDEIRIEPPPKTQHNLVPIPQAGVLVSGHSVEVQFSSSMAAGTAKNQVLQFSPTVQEGEFIDSPDLFYPHVNHGSLDSLFLILKVFYNSTNGDDWSYSGCHSNSQWNIARVPPSIEHLEQWCGLTFADGSLIEIALLNNGLTGAIPPELGDLKNLTHLNLSNNQLTSPIPPELGNLKKLTYLNLNRNQLPGQIPPELGNLKELTRLELRENLLIGQIPPELGNLEKLTHLDLSYNEDFTGPIPTEFGNLKQLLSLRLAGNHLTGSIPSELGNLKDLVQLMLAGNDLTGPIPPELGNLANLSLLYLFDNRLTGSIPPGLSNLGNLTFLNLSANQFTPSPFPTELLNLKQLMELALSGLTGQIPPELGDLENLKRLDLTHGELTGEIPAVLGNLTNLEHLNLVWNELTGPIPPELGNLENLEFLALNRNQLTGPIPTELSNLENLEFLALNRNQLTGPIPTELSNLENLVFLNLNVNSLTGPIPTELGNLENLEFMRLASNQLNGEIPTELGKLQNLYALDLGNNTISGTVPSELGLLVNLGGDTILPGRSFQTSGFLRLEGNHLTGALPQSLVQLNHLSSFRFESNSGLCAPLNAEFQKWLNMIENVTGDICVKVSFSEEVADQSYPRSHSIPPLILPEATTGVFPLLYTFTALDLPIGLQYNPGTRTVSGTPWKVTPPVSFTYKGTDATGSQDSLQFSIEVFSPVANDHQDGLPENFELRTNYPNPFQHSTHIAFDLPWPAQIQIEVMDVIGRRMMMEPPVNVEAGWQKKIEINGASLSSGIYLYRLIVESPTNRSIHVGRFTLVR